MNDVRHDERVPPSTPSGAGRKSRTGRLVLTDDDHSAMRTALHAERGNIEGQISELTKSFDDIVEAVESTNNDDEHDPEGTTIAFERAQVAALLNQAKDDLAAVESALDRLQDGSYGTCEDCGAGIGVERLGALPSATRCMSCA